MRKLIASMLSLALFTSILAGCGASAPNSVWSPRDVGDVSRPPTAPPVR